MIPHTLFMYWGANKLSWLRYLTVYSFHKMNPDWDIKIYYPTQLWESQTWTTGEQSITFDGDDWFFRLKDIPNVELISLDMEDLGYHNTAPEVHKSDLFRLWALSTYGGYYSDFDILYYKPVEPGEHTTIVSFDPSDRHWNIGFLACKADDPLYKMLYELAQGAPTNNYQSLGPLLWKIYINPDTLPETTWDIPKDLLYYHDAEHIADIFTKGKFLKKGIGLHWYGGHRLAGEWENRLGPANYQDYDILISTTIKEILS